MKAILVTRLDGPDSIELVDIDQPVPGPDEVLIRVRAAGVAFPDVLQTRGMYQTKPPMPYVPGAEVAGEIVSAPEGSPFAVGDRVVGFSMLGGFATHATATVDMTFALPDNVSFEKGASIPLNYLTAHFSLLPRGRMVAGESVLVHGAAGGVGTASIQIAKAYGAGQVIAVTSTDEKGQIALDAGADSYVLSEGFKDAVLALTDGEGVDIVLDPVGGDRFTDSLRSLRDDGRLLVVGFADGEIPTVKVNRLLLNNIEVVGVGWGAYTFKRAGYVAAEWADMLPHIESGAIDPPIGATFSLEQAADALNFIDQRKATGKVLILP